MKAKDLVHHGVPRGIALDAALAVLKRASGESIEMKDVESALLSVASDPSGFQGDVMYGDFAQKLIAARNAQATYRPPEVTAPYQIWGQDLEETALTQMENACKLPISVAGALMPDAHQGYGLPIGGVLATRGAVIPYAVGVDIACRMKMTVLDLPVTSIEEQSGRLKSALDRETRFGVGATFKERHQHPVLDRDWSVSPVTRQNKDSAWSQLGTSGSGNHFVEFGTFTLERPELSLEPGIYLALLSHSGSRGTGNKVATYFSKLAMTLHPELPKELSHLAWLDLGTEAGEEYWAAMELMGAYAAANHELIHRAVARNLGAEVLLDVENHHNYAWKENHGGEDVIVHRKGATPAGVGTLGIIPGSMANPGYLVRGKGNPASLNSAAHGAGRRMSRTAAKQQFTWENLNTLLRERKVQLISAGLDEVPMAYKDIDEVMAAQKDLVEIVARFDPRIVRMAPGDERPED